LPGKNIFKISPNNNKRKAASNKKDKGRKLSLALLIKKRKAASFACIFFPRGRKQNSKQNTLVPSCAGKCEIDTQFPANKTFSFIMFICYT